MSFDVQVASLLREIGLFSVHLSSDTDKITSKLSRSPLALGMTKLGVPVWRLTSKVSGSQPATYTNGKRPEPTRRFWRRLSPSAELLIDPESGARCAIRDSRRSGAERYLWTLTVFGYHQLTAGRTGDLAEARSQAEAALEGSAAA
jgi:hypothetical protein